MINVQRLSYKINLKSIPISNNLKKILNLKKLSKINYISRGDDYQALFTAPKSKRGIIMKTSVKIAVRITRIGLIQKNIHKSSIVDHNNTVINVKNKGLTDKIHEKRKCKRSSCRVYSSNLRRINNEFSKKPFTMNLSWLGTDAKTILDKIKKLANIKKLYTTPTNLKKNSILAKT